ncbi:YbaB/EbfC family nucleoid-associated protein [Saccharomonospora sp. NB11]|jgi:DNA-binding protein YbaB|uniref:YbaB/EbfC family nucleoid-associated protein n=1 Tax=Saccharomonospora sp. NB11 TaxID=1642298 RepID=UPI0018D1742E|nr:YbaB/EbfC family nucleoid-associated protein [Saccharomonospora sp. NB11]
MLGGNPTEAGERLERFAETLQKKAQGYTALHQQLGSASVTERSAGGEVEVTVDGNGVLTRLELSERTRGMDPASVSATIMGCLRQAQARLREQVASLVSETVGDDDPAGSNIVNQYAERFPYSVDEEETARQEPRSSLGRLGEETDADRREPRRPRPRRYDEDDEDLGGGSILR